MPIQVVRSDVQNDSNLRMKINGRLQLETRNLQHRPSIVARGIHQRNDRHTDVATHLHRQLCCVKNLAAQGRGRGFAVRARDRQHLAAQIMSRQLQLADNRQPEFPHLGQLRRIDWNPRTHNDQILPPEGQQAMPARLDRNSFIDQRRDFFGQRLSAAHIRHCHLRAAPTQKQCRRQPRLAEPNNQYFFPFNFHRNSQSAGLLCHAGSSLYRSFRVVSAKSANTSAPIQKRAITFDSDQPSNSK